MKKLTMLFSVLCLTVALTVPASALEYNIDGPGDPEYGKSTSIEPVITADRGELPNVDVSKNAALIPPTFGSPTAYTLNTGNPLTPNLAPGYMLGEGAVISGGTGVTVAPPDFNTIPSGIVSGGGSTGDTATPAPSTGYTEVTSDLYYKGGYLATLKIPSLNVNVKVYEGTGSSVLAKGAGHFEDTSIWDGNCCFAGHNRGTNCYFGDIHNLNVGDTITLTTKLGTRTYSVTSVNKISETDNSLLAPTAENCMIACREELENINVQLDNAKQEVEKPFPQEEELKTKSARLDELNILLNMDKRESEIVDGDVGDEAETPARDGPDRER